MANFNNHIKQVKKNLSFLQTVNEKIINSWDWQVTTCFYSAVHIINAHIAKKGDLHYHTHKQVDQAINPYSTTSSCKLEEVVYLSYKKLSGLSRRSRYLCHDRSSEAKKTMESSFLTHDKHLAKSIKHLDTILSFLSKEYSVKVKPLQISCPYLKSTTLSFFKIR